MREPRPLAFKTQNKAARLQMRLAPPSKKLLARAAAIRGASLSRFVIEVALAEAERVIQSHRSVKLSAPDWERFYDALIDPPAANAAMRRAAKRYRAVRRAE